MPDEPDSSAKQTQPLFALVLLTGPEQDRRVSVGEGESILLGRSPEAQIVIDDIKASRRHTRCYCEDGNLKVVDLGSFNGTFVNGNRIERAILFAGDSLQVASLRIKVESATNKLVDTQEQSAEAATNTKNGPTSGTTMGNVLSDVLTPAKVADMVKFLRERNKTGALVIHTSWGSGKIYFRKGAVFSASIEGAPHIPPEKAIQRLMRSQSGSIAYSVDPPAPQGEEISGTLEEIIQEDANFPEVYSELEKQMPSPTAGLTIAESAITAGEDFTHDEEEVLHLVRQKGTVSHLMDHFSGTDTVAIQTLLALARHGFIKYVRYAR